MRNFDYLKELELNDLHRFCAAAEEHQVCNPDFSAVNARKALEYIVRSLYKMKNLEIAERTSLFELVDGEPFKEFIGDDRVMMAVQYVRKVGNRGAHAAKVSKKEAYFCLLNIYNIVAAFLTKLKIVEHVKPFDKELIPTRGQGLVMVATSVEAITPSEKIIKAADKAAIDSNTPVEMLVTDISEAETRNLYIDLMLHEAGWEVQSKKGAILPSKACIEIELEGMPNQQGIGYADYVLYGADAKPLAVIEAKRTSHSPSEGKHQAELYAQCLEQRYDIKPVIYYTNGFETYIIDGVYPPRRVYAFHTEADLRLLILHRSRGNITNIKINPTITDRHYQITAITAVCEHLNKRHRRALLVMATGTGKTRVAISLVDVLMKNDWVKNVLFLADRTSLVKQAQRNFAKLLPNATTAILNENDAGKKDMNARIMFSTYQTMINYIDTDEKQFSVGRFDLIIIDEAHRSVFGKYGAIFNYFDSMLVGLTATPREEVARSTYELLELDDGHPNFDYNLAEAINDGYLVPYTAFKRGTLILRNGIKYDSLTAEQKEQLEKVWDYEQTKRAVKNDKPKGRDIDSKEIFSYIFNIDTVDKVLQDLMENGIAVEGGDKIGKTIIFAYNHDHAEMVVKRFYALYPEYGADFCVLIDNYVNYAQSLIDKFEVRGKKPQIAVSVDMLDTGIDVPDILNLVFFKNVKSKIKFNQMIGRGTRLSKDIFGEGKDKEEFYIYDWCRNFEYFSINPNGVEAKPTQSLTERLFCLSAELAFELQHTEHQEIPFHKHLHNRLKQEMMEQVGKLNDKHISVREHWQSVARFKYADNWLCLSMLDVSVLKDDISPLLPKNQSNEAAKRFDLLVMAVELSQVKTNVNAHRCVDNIIAIAESLSQKGTIPQIQSKIETINMVLSNVFWENLSLEGLEKVREELRDLVKFVFAGQRQLFEINIEDTFVDEGLAESVATYKSYKQKVMEYLADNRNLPVIQKILNIEQLTEADICELEHILWQELGTKKDYDYWTANMLFGGSVAAFIRSLIGIDRAKALEKFTTFIGNNILN